ncbi:hypothetical protein ABTY98_19305 [Streptomyces sp. NPDC096040]|uniref:hypothetical protein n=1 Tax=Streptomyces sp. NPDC096040 TaxID=3155541 RepID=UPI0033258778
MNAEATDRRVNAEPDDHDPSAEAAPTPTDRRVNAERDDHDPSAERDSHGVSAGRSLVV